MLLQSAGPPGSECGGGGGGAKPCDAPGNKHHDDHDGTNTHMLDYAPAPGWTVHAGKDGRLYYCNGITLQGAIDIAYSDENVSDIYIEPPDCNELTDEDSGDEDDAGMVDNLSGRQLSARAELVLTNNERIGGGDQDFQDPIIEDETSEFPHELNISTKPESPKYINGDLVANYPDFPLGDYSEYSSMTCVQMFELFFTDELLDNIVKETRDYALLKNCADPKLSVEELKVFLGILIVSGYNILPSKRSYWENVSDMKNIMVSEAMRRDRFLQICRFIHFANNSAVDLSDKMYKLRSLADYLKIKFLDHFVPEKNLSYDESMIRYFGRHGCKQFIRGKPVRFGYKVWCLNTPSGYLINFEVYQGKNPRSNANYESVFGKPTAPLLQMIEDMAAKKSYRYNFFFDNLFTGSNILCTLKANGYGGTGTIRDNRLPKNCPLASKKELEKQTRGNFSSTIEWNSGVLYVRWKDNNVVTMASTCFGIAPLRSVDRFSRKDKKIISVPRPNLVGEYNKNMGGTDQMDNNISCHVTRTAGWLPPVEAWKTGEDALPYGWERALDDSGRTYYINHVNKTTTYETPVVKNLEPAPKPEPRTVTLERSPSLGFGFVAGSEKPVIVRFVTEGGPSVDKLLPGDQILSVNGEDVKSAPREHVISLVRACTKTVNLVVCQPAEQQGARKSTLLSASKRARLRSKPSRVRFAESVCVNGAPLFPPSAFSLGDLCVPPMANVLKVFLENGQTKSFKYDAWTTVQDVVTSLETKLCLQATEHFSLVVEHIKSLKRNKLTLLDPQDTLARIASRPGAHKLRCLFRVAFVPASAAALAQRDLHALDYLYIQCCNDVIQERFAPELQYETALRLSALHIYQHALANNIPSAKLTVKTVEREFGLERFVPGSILETMKRKEIRKLVGHFLKLHASMAGPGKQLTALQAKLHYLDIVSQLPSYGAKCFSAGPRGDAMERVILVSPKFGISQITGTRNSVPVPIANIEDMRRIEVRSEDEISRTVLIKLQNDKVVSISLEERDASELVLVLRGYFKLETGQNLPVDQEEAPPMEDLAPPYLSQHKVVPEKWSYINQSSMKNVCFTMQPMYKGINKKTNGLYNTMGRQSKPFGTGYSLDSNMNSSFSNRNHQFNSFDNNSIDFQSVVSMEILENGIVEAKNDEVLRRVHEMHQLVENSEKYLTEQENLERLNALSEWQETSVDIESDSDEPGQLKHSDSLLLLTKGHTTSERRHSFTNATIELLRQETTCSESDNDSIYTPQNSPKHKQIPNEDRGNRISFGLRSPDNSADKEQDFQAYLQHLRDIKNNGENLSGDLDSINDIYVFDPDIIDLTMIPPPSTPDELYCALPTPINVPPRSFADSVDKLNKLGILNEDQDLEEFLASVTVLPPTQKVTPSVELTPEEIMAYIIPPPPSRGSLENLVMSEAERYTESLPVDVQNNSDTSKNCNGVRRRNSNGSVHSNIIEYATVDRKGPFSCCAKNKTEKLIKTEDNIQPLPRRSSDEKPPDRPPKNLSQDRQRSQSLTSSALIQANMDYPPKLPPRGENNHQAPAHLFLPPKKPPLPPVPPIEVLRQKKNIQQGKACADLRTASIGSPHFQRTRNVSNDLDVTENGDNSLTLKHNTAVSTPTSPHLGRGAHLTAVPVPIDSPGTPNTQNNPQTSPASRSPTYIQNLPESSPIYERHKNSPREQEQVIGGCQMKNGCTSNRENLLVKTDVAMASLLVRLDQVAAQCSAAQVHGGGRFISEEKFQAAKDELTSQSLQLVTSSKMLVIAMSDPSLPDLPENLAICLTILRKLTELCQDLTNHTTAPLQTRNLILKVHDVTAAFRHLITSDIDRSSQKAIEEHLAAQAECLANVLATLLRSLRVFSP